MKNKNNVKENVVKKSIILARVSTDEQDSNDAQLNRLRKFAIEKGFENSKEYPIKESSSKAERKKFQEIIDLIKKSKQPIALFVDTIDRLQRSFKESVIFDELRKEGKVEVFFYRENLRIHRDSNSAELLQWDMGVMFARSYVLQLSDNVKRKFEQKRKDGEITGQAPFGYKSIPLDKRKRTRQGIEIDPERAPIVKEIFERYLNEDISTKVFSDELKKRKVTTIRNTPIHGSVVYGILKNTFYYGMAYSKRHNDFYPHIYEPIITKELFDKVQDKLASKNMCPTKMDSRKKFIFGGMLRCAKCGCTMSPEIKKGKYIYYACTNAKRICKREYVKEEELLKPVKKFLRDIRLSDEKIKDIITYLKDNHEKKTLFHKRKIVEVDKKYDKTQNRINNLLDCLTDGVISKEDYENKLREYKDEQYNLNLEKEKLTQNDEGYHIVALTVLKLAQRAEEIFENSDTDEKNQLLEFLLQNPTVNGKKLCFTKLEPFKSIVEMPRHFDLLRGQGSNLRPSD